LVAENEPWISEENVFEPDLFVCSADIFCQTIGGSHQRTVEQVRNGVPNPGLSAKLLQR
jgi:hypothetical protein